MGPMGRCRDSRVPVGGPQQSVLLPGAILGGHIEGWLDLERPQLTPQWADLLRSPGVVRPQLKRETLEADVASALNRRAADMSFLTGQGSWTPGTRSCPVNAPRQDPPWRRRPGSLPFQSPPAWPQPPGVPCSGDHGPRRGPADKGTPGKRRRCGPVRDFTLLEKHALRCAAEAAVRRVQSPEERAAPACQGGGVLNTVGEVDFKKPVFLSFFPLKKEKQAATGGAPATRAHTHVRTHRSCVGAGTQTWGPGAAGPHGEPRRHRGVRAEGAEAFPSALARRPTEANRPVQNAGRRDP